MSNIVSPAKIRYHENSFGNLTMCSGHGQPRISRSLLCFHWMASGSLSSAEVCNNRWGCLNNNIFSNLGLCAACWARFMYHHELWPTSVGHPFSSLNSSPGFAGGQHHQKIAIPIFRPVLQNFAIPGWFPYILFYSCLFSLLSSGWFVIAVCGSVSVQETS